MQTTKTAGKPGPNTEAGKAISAQNAVKHGLFATHDFIRLGERDEYDAFAAAFRDQLAPDGPLEELFTTEIIGANWRLRRCRLIEHDLSAKYDEIDPMQDSDGDKVQRSIDRARAQAHNAIRRALAEMRKLQTERFIRTELKLTKNLGLADFPKMVATLGKCGLRLKLDPLSETPPEPEDTNPSGPADPFCNDAPDPDSFCKGGSRSTFNHPTPHHKIGRNESCPCGSGLKFKRCCLNRPKSEPKLAA